MKLLMVTRADDKVKEIAELTHPVLKRYAEKWDADFLVLSEDYDSKGWGIVHYRLMRLYDLLEKYDRILNIDSDVVINKTCPNLFDIVPYDKIGVIYEDVGTRELDRKNRIRLIQLKWGNIGWIENYINSGVCLVSKPHREIFKRYNGKLWEKHGYTDVFFGYQIHRLNLEIFELDWHYNHMSIFSEAWNGRASRFDSHIIHYAGHAAFPDKGKRTKTILIRDDMKRIYG